MATIEQFIGTDILHIRDFRKTISGGNLQTVSGLENLRQAILRRLVTTPGQLVHRPLYGAGLPRFQNAPNTLDTRRTMSTIIEEQILRDPRIESVSSVNFRYPDPKPENVEISVICQAKGYGELTVEFRPFGEI